MPILIFIGGLIVWTAYLNKSGPYASKEIKAAKKHSKKKK